MADDLRTRVIDATFDEVAVHGLAALTVESVATRAETSRATIYRHFPGGRDELVETTIRREVSRFFAALLAEAPAAADDPVAHVEGLVIHGHRRLRGHDVLQRLLVEEADAIVPSLATVHPMVQSGLAAHLEGVLAAAETCDGVEVAPAAEFCARMLLSFIGSGGAWDLADPDDVRELVRGHLLAGVVP